jgi:hypothetical protein
VVGFNAVGVFGTEFTLAFFGTWRVAVEGGQVERQVVQLFAVDRTPSKLEGSARLPITSTIGLLKFWRPAVRVVLETRP